MSHKGKRGGAWKVAYADFATALMSLFIVLWIMNASATVKKSVAGYFRDPRGYAQKAGAGPANSGEGLKSKKPTAEEVKKAIANALRAMPEFTKFADNIKLSVTGEGLRIDLMENQQGLFFVSGIAEPTPIGQALIGAIAHEVSKLPNTIVVEGHTDALPYRNASAIKGYGNWELSTDRANAARRLLSSGGIPAERIVEVRGFADRRTIEGSNPENPRNRRISIVVRLVGEG
jgi:chemotaxis protein MotB